MIPYRYDKAKAEEQIRKAREAGAAGLDYVDTNNMGANKAYRKAKAIYDAEKNKPFAQKAKAGHQSEITPPSSDYIYDYSLGKYVRKGVYEHRTPPEMARREAKIEEDYAYSKNVLPGIVGIIACVILFSLLSQASSKLDMIAILVVFILIALTIKLGVKKMNQEP